jgi:hypothetical protein
MGHMESFGEYWAKSMALSNRLVNFLGSAITIVIGMAALSQPAKAVFAKIIAGAQ